MNAAQDYIPHPVTPEDHLHNCQFQLDNITGWLMMARDEGGSTNTAAVMKAECLIEAATALLACLKQELRPTAPLTAES